MFADLLYKYFIASFIVGGGFFISFKIIDKFVYAPMLKESEEDAEFAGLTEEEIEIKKYNKLYLEDYDNLEINEMDENALHKLQKCFLIEETPLGVVKMYYCNDNESFIYWSEKQLPYKVLETVSRKYVIDYDCKFIYVDMEYELKKKREELMNTMDNVSTDVSNADVSNADDASNTSSVFVTFKKYNSPEKTPKKKNPENVIVCDKANRYSYRGVYNPDQDQKISGGGSLPSVDGKKMSVSDFLKAKRSYQTENIEKLDEKVSDGFWRFLDMKFYKSENHDDNVFNTEYVSYYDDTQDDSHDDSDDDSDDDSEEHSECERKYNIINGNGGQYSINNKFFTDRDKYHKCLMQELTNHVKNSDCGSDNSFDLLECDVEKNEKNEVLNLDSAVESGLTRRRSASYSEDSHCDKKTLDDKKSNSWLW